MGGTLRFLALIRTAANVARSEGVFAAGSRLGHWLKGARGYHREFLEIAAPSYPEFKRRTAPSPRAFRRQTRAAEKWASPQVLLITIARRSGQLEATAQSILQQTFGAWRWLILSTDRATTLSDRRIEIVTCNDDEQELLQTINRRLESLPGEHFAGFVEAGDTLMSDGLYEIVKALRDGPANVGAVYSDSEVAGIDAASDVPVLKPDWSPEMMLSVNLMAGLSFFNAALLVKAGGLSSLDPVAGLWDVGLRVGRMADHVAHVPRILHRRASAGKITESACAPVLRSHLQALALQEPVVNFVEGRITCRWTPREQRLVSIIIPTRNLPKVLRACLESIYLRTPVERFELVLVDTGSTDPAIPPLYEAFAAHGNFRLFRDDAPFNFSRVCNVGAREARGELLLFLNNDTEVLDTGWLDRLAQWFDLPGVGMVGPKLLYPTGAIQHAGVIVGIHGLADNFMSRMPEHSRTVFGSDDDYRDLSAVTGACMMVSRAAFDLVGGFNENYRLNFSDVQLSVDVVRAGWRVVYTPDVRLLHHESLTHQRRIPEEDVRLGKQSLAPEIAKGDPYYHPYLSRHSPRPLLTLRRHGAKKVL